MAYQLVASGNVLALANLGQWESQLDEGDKALLELDLRLPVSQDIASKLEEQLRQWGVPEVRVTTASPMLKIFFRKGFPWLAVLAAVILGLIVLAVLIVGWRLFKEIGAILGEGGLVPALILGAGLLLGAIILVRRKVSGSKS